MDDLTRAVFGDVGIPYITIEDEVMRVDRVTAKGMWVWRLGEPEAVFIESTRRLDAWTRQTSRGARRQRKSTIAPRGQRQAASS